MKQFNNANYLPKAEGLRAALENFGKSIVSQLEKYSQRLPESYSGQEEN